MVYLFSIVMNRLNENKSLLQTETEENISNIIQETKTEQQKPKYYG